MRPAAQRMSAAGCRLTIAETMKGQGQGQADRRPPLAPQRAVLDGGGHDDERELGVGRHGQTRHGGGAPAHAEDPHRDGVDGGAHGQQDEEEGGQREGASARDAVESDGQEEADEQELLDGEQGVGQLLGGGVGGEEGAHDEGAEVAVDAEQAEQEVAGQQRHGHAEQGAHLAVVDAVEDLAEQPGGGPQGHERRRPGAGDVPGGDGHVQHRGDVLDDEDPDGDAPVEGAGVAALLQELDDDDGGGEGQGEAEDEHARRRDGVDPQAQEQQPTDQGAAQPREDDHGHHGGARDLPAGQDAQVELEADGEQEDGHAQVAQDVDEFEVGQGGGPEQEAGGEEADERGQAQEGGGESQDDDD